MSASRSPAFPCARCGRPIRRVPRAVGGRRTLTLHCPRCRYMIYDYPRPCAGLIVRRDETVLVLRRGHAPRKGWLDFPGGFMEAGESIEAAARRELLEETGLRVGKAAWLGFYWDRYYLRGFGYLPTMNFYYVARWHSGIPRAADDAASCEWVPLEKIGRRGHRFAWKHMKDIVAALRRARTGADRSAGVIREDRTR